MNFHAKNCQNSIIFNFENITKSTKLRFLARNFKLSVQNKFLKNSQNHYFSAKNSKSLFSIFFKYLIFGHKNMISNSVVILVFAEFKKTGCANKFGIC